MTLVAHGGDAGGDPPGGSWDPPRSHITKPNVRKKTTCYNLREEFRKNQYQPLKVEFDVSDQGTGRPVCEHGQMIISLIGSIVRDNTFPKHYPSWARVPQDKKLRIWPEIRKYFDMRPWLDGGDKERTVRGGVEAICQERYKGAKADFTKESFVARNGYEDPNHLRDDPPAGVPPDVWGPFVDYVTSPSQISRAEKNSENRSKQKYASKHGSRSYVSRRAYRRAEDPTCDNPSHIDNYEQMHVDKQNKEWVSEEAETLHRQMVDLKTRSPLTSEEDIMDAVLGVRRGHNRGRGRKLPMSATSSLPTSSNQPSSSTMDINDNVIEQRVQQEMRRFLQAFQASNPGFVVPNYPVVDDHQIEEAEDDTGEDNVD